MSVTFNVNSKEFDKAVKEAIKSVSDLTPVFIQMAREFYKANKAIFALKGKGKYEDFKGPKIGATWKDPGMPERRTRNGTMTPYQWYKHSKLKMPKGYPLLRASGTLERSITRQGDTNAILEINKTTMVVGTRLEYAGFHQYGTKHIPMRQFLFLDATTTAPNEISRRNDAWMKSLNSYVFRSVAKPLGSEK